MPDHDLTPDDGHLTEALSSLAASVRPGAPLPPAEVRRRGRARRQRRRRTIAASAGLLVAVVALGGVVLGLGPDREDATRPPAQPTPRPSASRAVGPGAGLDLRLPPGIRFFVPETAGTGKGRLPTFTVGRGYFTVALACSGRGPVQLVDTGRKAGSAFGGTGPTCDGVRLAGAVAQEGGTYRYEVDAPAGTEWSAAVVEGDALGVTSPGLPALVPSSPPPVGTASASAPGGLR